MSRELATVDHEKITCGFQRTHMRLPIETESPEKYGAWTRASASPTTPPQTPLLQHGRDVLMQARLLAWIIDPGSLGLGVLRSTGSAGRHRAPVTERAA